MISRYFSLVLLALVLSITGCANLDKQTVGATVGAVAGGLLGDVAGGGRNHRNRNIMPALIGAALGAWAGSSIGRYMDQADKDRADALLGKSLNQSNPGTYPESWTGSQGYPIESRVTTNNPYYEPQRDTRVLVKPYTQETTVLIDGRPQVAIESGVAKFEYPKEYPQGIWKLYPEKKN